LANVEVEEKGPTRLSDPRIHPHHGSMIHTSARHMTVHFHCARAGKAGSDAASAHVPFRDSKLTQLLMDSLGGEALALMIATCSPAARAADETLSTLHYATSAQSIRNRPVVRLDPQQEIVRPLPHALLDSSLTILHRGLHSNP
jgi:hypothetical protein